MTVTRLIAALIAGAVGAYAGLFALLSVTGLDQAGWAPVAMLTGAALFGSLTTGLVAKLPGPTVAGLTAAATALGALAGLVIRPLQDGYEWVIAVGIVLIVGLVIVTEKMQADAEQPEQTRHHANT